LNCSHLFRSRPSASLQGRAESGLHRRSSTVLTNVCLTR
jgi:hypothetical protein